MFFKKFPIFVALACLLLSGSLAFTRLKHAPFPSLSKINISESYGKCLDLHYNSHQIGVCLKDLGLAVNKSYTLPELEAAVSNFNPTELHWCHEFMHYAGWGVFENKKSLPASFSIASGLCDNGMYHGIMEEYIKDLGIAYNTENFANNIIPHACDQVISSSKFPAGISWTCYHGLGHAFMFITNEDLNASLKFCDNLGDKAQGCYTGALMENIQTKEVGQTPTHPNRFAFNTKDPDYPCNILDKKYNKYCYLYKGSSNVVLEKGDFGKAFQDCLKVIEPYRSKCFYGVGSDVPAPQFTSSEAAAKCRAALDVSPEAYRQCVLGAMAFIPELNLGNFHAAVDFCGVIETDYKNICYNAAGRNFKNWATPEDPMEKKCSLFKDTKAREICLNPDKN